MCLVEFLANSKLADKALAFPGKSYSFHACDTRIAS
jgi:hypothetical protein